MSDQGHWAALLQRRAEALAKPAKQSEERAGNEVLVLSVAGRRYAIESRFVRQVASSSPLARLPESPGELVGLTVIHGDAVPVADLGALLGQASAGQGRRFTVVLGVDEPPVGVLVDAVLTAEALPRGSREATYKDLAERTPLETGVSPDGVVILDGRALLDDDRLHVRRTSSLPRSGAGHDEGAR